MVTEIRKEEDLVRIGKYSRTPQTPPTVSAFAPRVLGIHELLALGAQPPGMLIDGILPAAGATLVVGAPKSNKTLLAIQIALAVASGRPLFGQHSIINPGAVLMIEQDDPAGAVSVGQVLHASTASVVGIPFHFLGRVAYSLGPEFCDFIQEKIPELKLRLIVLDSYTALRRARKAGGDIVKTEQAELAMLDELAKRTGVAMMLIHHSSKGSKMLDWSDQPAGSYAVGAAIEAQIHISRFCEMANNAEERLLRIRGRHMAEAEMVLRFREKTLDHEVVLSGGASPFYYAIKDLRREFGDRAFSPKELTWATGMSQSSAHRCLGRLVEAGAVSRQAYGQYSLQKV
jgi:hypothetical protein